MNDAQRNRLGFEIDAERVYRAPFHEVLPVRSGVPKPKLRGMLHVRGWLTKGSAPGTQEGTGRVRRMVGSHLSLRRRKADG